MAVFAISPRPAILNTSTGGIHRPEPTPTPADAWSAIRRSLSAPLPEPCALARAGESMRVGRTLGDGPLYPVAGPDSLEAEAVFRIYGTFKENDRYGIKVLWVAPPTFAGKILVRGVAADGTTLAFGIGQTPELRIEWKGGASDAWVEPDGWREAGGYTWVPGPGCHQWQVDMNAGTSLIVFRADLAE